MSVWGPSPLHILQIYSLQQFATVTPSYVPLRRRGTIIAIFQVRGSGINCIVSVQIETKYQSAFLGPNFIPYAGSRINLSTTFSDSYFWKRFQERPYLQILLCFSSNPSNLVGKVFFCGRSWPQLQLRHEGTPPDFEAFFLEKRPWKRFSINVLIRGEMNPLHKHKIMSVWYQVKQNLKSRSWTLF